MYVYMDKYMYVYVYVYLGMYVYVYKCVYVCVCVCVFHKNILSLVIEGLSKEDKYIVGCSLQASIYRDIQC